MSRLLIPLLLCVLCVWVCVSDQRDYGVKLCGREFIRAVIFTCGGSRWRRFVHPLTPNNPNLPSSYQSYSQSDDNLSWLTTNKVAPPEQSSFLSSSSSTLSDLLQLMGEQTDPREEPDPAEQAPQSHVGSSSFSLSPGPDSSRSLDLHWRGQNRRRRNFSHGLAGLCCNQGCTKNDIGRLC